MTRDRVLRLLVVRPLPPPPGGTSVSFQLFCNELLGHHTEMQRVIEFIGPVPDARELMCAADVFVLSSDYEKALSIQE